MTIDASNLCITSEDLKTNDLFESYRTPGWYGGMMAHADAVDLVGPNDCRMHAVFATPHMAMSYFAYSMSLCGAELKNYSAEDGPIICHAWRRITLEGVDCIKCIKHFERAERGKLSWEALNRSFDDAYDVRVAAGVLLRREFTSYGGPKNDAPVSVEEGRRLIRPGPKERAEFLAAMPQVVRVRRQKREERSRRRKESAQKRAVVICV